MKAGLSQKTLAQRAGVSIPALSYLENGLRRTSLLVTLKLADGLNVPPCVLLDRARSTQKDV